MNYFEAILMVCTNYSLKDPIRAHEIIKNPNIDAKISPIPDKTKRQQQFPPQSSLQHDTKVSESKITLCYG
jgi:hypothetical protein